MISLLQSILCVLLQIPYFIVWAVITALNGVILTLATVLAGLVALMPVFPDFPTVPSEVTAVTGWVAWFFPVGTVVAIVAFLLTAWLVWQGVSLALRWAKVIE